MKRIEQAGKLDDWCQDNLDWLKKTYGAENIVSAVVHLDETTPHIHATMIPILTGERRKAKAEQATREKKYRKKSTDTARLCADDVMSRVRLKEYQNTYAEQMAKYGLQRGIDGSQAKHVTTSQYYRDLLTQSESVQENITDLLEQKQQAEQELTAVKADISKEKLKNSAADVGTKLMDGVSSLLGTPKVNKIFDLFPHIEELLKFEKFCRAVGFGTQMIRQLFNRETVSFKGEIYSHKHQRKFKTEHSLAKVEPNPQQPTKFRLNIDGMDSYDWFRQKQKEFLNALGINPKEKRGLKI